MRVRASTPEENEARRVEVAAALCRGDGINSHDLRFSHDWRLMEPTAFGYRWYCTRCRKFEETAR